MADIEVVEVGLPGGGTIFVRAEQMALPVASGEAKPRDIGLKQVLSFSTVSEALRGVATDLRGAIQAVRPDAAEVEFGLQLGIRGSRLACLLVDAGTTATIRVRLRWDSGDGARDAQPATRDAQPEISTAGSESSAGSDDDAA